MAECLDRDVALEPAVPDAVYRPKAAATNQLTHFVQIAEGILQLLEKLGFARIGGLRDYRGTGFLANAGRRALPASRTEGGAFRKRCLTLGALSRHSELHVFSTFRSSRRLSQRREPSESPIATDAPLQRLWRPKKQAQGEAPRKTTQA